MSDATPKQLTFHGIGVSPGIAIGSAYLLEQENVDVIEKRFVQPKDIDSEINRFKNAVQKAQEYLHRIIQEVPDEYQDHVYILDSHVMLLKDRMIYDGTIEQIKETNVNAEWALKIAVDKVKAIFKQMGDPYFRERVSDIAHVSRLILQNLLGTGHSNISDIDKLGEEVAELAVNSISPIDDVRATAEYRSDMARLYVKRMVKKICS